MERCARCRAREDEIRLFDAIYEGKMSYLCERCSIIENIPIIKKPDISQLKESEKGISVNKRMKTLSGINEQKQEETFFKEDKLKELEQNPEKEIPEKNNLNLIEHYYWEIMKNRRRKGLSQKQLAQNLGESEIAIQMIEKNKLPENAERLIKKLEQFFQVKLRKLTEMEKYLEQKNKEPVLLDEQGKEIEIIPEPEQVIIETIEEENPITEIESFEKSKELERIKDSIPEESENEFETRYFPIIRKNNKQQEQKISEIISKESEENPTKEQILYNAPPDIDIKKVNPDKITINQLKELHRKKIQATRQEQLEEQRKIEERQRILEAKREQDRIKQEQIKQQQELEKQRIEQQKQRIIEQRKQELEQRKKREFEEIDQYLGGTELLNKNNQKDLESKDSIEEFDKELI